VTVRTEQLDILRCPITGSGLRLATNTELSRANDQLANRTLRTLAGFEMDRPISDAVVAEDRLLYPVIDNIHLLTIECAIQLDSSPLRAPTSRNPSDQIKSDVRAFYDHVGWQHAGKVTMDAELFEDLRQVSEHYRHACNVRVVTHLPSRGRYLLDAASGPIQYQDYLDFSEHFEVRVCVDFSMPALRAAKRKLGDKAFCVLADVTNLPLRDECIDGFVSLHTIYHVPSSEQRTAFLELYRVLKTGGSGVVVYSWGDRYSIRFAEAPFRIVPKLRKLGRKLKTGSREKDESAGPISDSLYFEPHSYSWFSSQDWPFQYQVLTWRSISVPMLRHYVLDSAFGRHVLNHLKRLEERFPSQCGRWGQYPLIAVSKASTAGTPPAIQPLGWSGDERM
jgi:ubiquinone/menaquinone biosynthesis C-methylase UbiE